MKKKSTSQSAFFNLRVLIGLFIAVAGVFLALLGVGAFSSATAQGSNQKADGPQPGRPQPDVIRMVGPVALNQDLRTLRYIPQEGETEEYPLTRHPHRRTGRSAPAEPSSPLVQSLTREILQPVPKMPPPVLTFDGVNRVTSGCNCAPPDTDGDVGPNHYVQAVNVSFKIFDKNGNTLSGPTTYNSLFAPLVGTPCSSFNNGDPFVFYDHVADRWIISDFAFPGSVPGPGPFYQCIAVSQTADPVAGGWFLYALQHEPSHPTWIGDYPKMAMWNSPQPGGAYHLTVNLFDGPSLAFEGVRTFALDRGSMLTGGPANAIGFTILPAGVGDSYSLVPAIFRTGTPPPAGRDEFLLAVDSPATGGVTLTQVKGWLFHVDFAVPANSTIGVGADHTPNALMTVNAFVDAFTDAAGFSLVPQQGTTSKIQTLGDKIMTPLVYQNRAGTESLWANQTVILNYPNGPTAVRWYQFNVTGGGFPAGPAQQQDWTNGNDALWRFMPALAVDQNGNMAIGYSLSSAAMFPGIRYAGRLASDPSNNLGQGEAILFTGTGSQVGTNGRWGDYSYTAIDPADGLSFWHTNEYYVTTSSFNWATRIGKFQFSQQPTVQTAVSRKTHTGVGPFDINLPLTGTPGIECRIGGAGANANDFTMVVTFTGNVSVTGTPQAEVILGTGCVGTGGVCNGGAVTVSGAIVTIPLTNIADDQTINVRLNGVNSVADVPATDVVIPMTRSLGDTNGTGVVTSADIAQTKSRIGQLLDGTNFRSDVNLSGGVNSSDVSIVKSNLP